VALVAYLSLSLGFSYGTGEVTNEAMMMRIREGNRSAAKWWTGSAFMDSREHGNNLGELPGERSGAVCSYRANFTGKKETDG
jgi:hypothetical protein